MKGKKAEKRVESSLKHSGANVKSPKASRGSADKIARWPSGKKWFVQVKYSTKKLRGLSERERNNLIKRAERNRGTPVLAQVTSKDIIYRSVKTGKKLQPKER